MIIVCKNCRASFIVPSSTFASGAKTVRCAVCKSVWKELPPTKGHQHKAQPKPDHAYTPSPHHTNVTPKDFAPPPVAIQQTETSTTEQQTEREKISFGQWLARFKNLVAISLVIVMGLLLFIAAVIVAGHSLIIETWPQTQSIYIDFGLAKNPLKDNLFLRNINSERRYIDGAMQLFVTGEILSQTQKTQVVPDIAIEALGPDGHVIESWRIAPPKATMAPNTTAPFSASFLSPGETVVEVNLSFVEPPHDEK